jgi:hypothetical protein
MNKGSFLKRDRHAKTNAPSLDSHPRSGDVGNARLADATVSRSLPTGWLHTRKHSLHKIIIILKLLTSPPLFLELPIFLYFTRMLSSLTVV